MTRQERIEAVERKANQVAPGGGAVSIGELLDAAYPELASGTHVLVPREPTKEMVRAWWGTYKETDEDCRTDWKAMLKAYLQSNPE